MTNTPSRIIQSGVAASAEPARAGNRPGPLVEDTSVVGGTDRATGAPVIRPRTTSGAADAMTEATDPSQREKR